VLRSAVSSPLLACIFADDWIQFSFEIKECQMSIYISVFSKKKISKSICICFYRIFYNKNCNIVWKSVRFHIDSPHISSISLKERQKKTTIQSHQNPNKQRRKGWVWIYRFEIKNRCPNNKLTSHRYTSWNLRRWLWLVVIESAPILGSWLIPLTVVSKSVWHHCVLTLLKTVKLHIFPYFRHS
jgi:hypothetical protein